MEKLSRKGYDSLTASATFYEKARQMKKDIKALKRKSPEVEGMYSVEIPAMRITFYYKTAKEQKIKIVKIKERYPTYSLIIKNPKK